MSPSKKKPQGDVGLAEPKTKAKPKLDRPRLYKVLLHNDDYTPMEFVVSSYARSSPNPTPTRLRSCCTRTRTAWRGGRLHLRDRRDQVQQTMAPREKAAFPLLCTMEPEDAPG